MQFDARLWDYLDAKRGIIMRAPVAFLAMAVLGSLAGYSLTTFYDGKLFALEDAKERTIAEERDRANRDNERLQKEVNDLKAYRGKDAPPIKKSALILASQIHEYIKDWKDLDDPVRKMENVRRYLQRFGARASIMRDDLDQNGQDSPSLDKEMQAFEWNYQDIRIIANEIEILASKLPD